MLTIQSADQGPGDLSSEITLTVNVIDNAPPVVTNEVIFIDENTSNGTFVAASEYSDPDGDTAFLISASFNLEGILIVDEGGNISVQDESLLNFEVNQSIENTESVVIVSIRDTKRVQVIEPQGFLSIFDKIANPINNVYNNLTNFQDVSNEYKLQYIRS